MPTPLKIFIIYSSRDRELRDAFLKHIKTLVRAEKIRVWSDADIPPGEPWNDEIRKKLEETELFIPLVSVNFFNSDFIEKVELPFAEAQRRLGRAFMIPVLLNHCGYKHDPVIGALEVIPKDRPITAREWENVDAAWTHVVAKINERVEGILNNAEFWERRKKPEERSGVLERDKASAEPDSGPDMVFVRGGTFDMGDVMGDGVSDDETVHRVTVADFYIGRTEVTFEEYDRFCEATGREKPSDEGWGRGRRPVINVSWYDAVEYCNWLSARHGLTPYYTVDKTRKDPNNTNDFDNLKWTVTPRRGANGYRLPTEAEWEYAAREGGKRVRFGNGKDIADPREINFDGRADEKAPYSVVGEHRGRTVPVGSLNSPNGLGLHDMSGNVLEWCWDWYGPYSASGSAQDNPQGPVEGSYRVNRGGSWFSYPRNCRAAYRNGWRPTYRIIGVGFRHARS